MCGIAGFLDPRAGLDEETAVARARRMIDAINHRGPDACWEWTDVPSGLALAHCRLATIDPSPLGHQPMHSSDGRLVITYNGEVYNFPDLRAKLEALGHRFRGGSDTEVVLAACLEWGPDHAVTAFAGMFAFALWDRETRTLRLVRDRIGVKPLYWAQFADALVFGSELKALMAHPAWEGHIDRAAAADFVRHGYVPGNGSIFRGVNKLAPGTMLTVSPGKTPRIESYWQLSDAVAAGLKDQISDEREAAERLDALLRDCVRGRMIADVPLGALLSGGVDSATVVALMQAQATRKVRTFTLGFREAGYDEAPAARKIAAHLGTDHTELYVTARDAFDVIPDLPRWFDEPFADSSQIPALLLSGLARKHVTVALSGDGGDEVFAGYPRYRFIDQVWRRMLAAPLRHALGSMISRMSEASLDRAFSKVPQFARPRNAGRRLRRAGEILREATGDSLSTELVAVWPQGGRLILGAAQQRIATPVVPPHIHDPVSRAQYIDMLGYLPDDILTKVDRCSMAVGLEVREPLLDHRLIEFAWRLPRRFKLAGGKSKRLLRTVLHRHVPPKLIERRKMGFSVPLAEWLRGPLRNWADDLLAPHALKADALFDAREVRRLWDEHQSRQADRAPVLWNVLMFQAWCARYRATL